MQEMMNLMILNVGHAEHEGDWNWKDVNSPFARIYLVTEGSAQLEISSVRYDLLPGHMYMIPSNCTHNDICSSHFAHYYLHVYESPLSATRIFEDWDIPVEVKAERVDYDLFATLCSNLPSRTLPQSNPLSYDNSSNLLRSIENSRNFSLYERMETSGIVLQLVSRFFKDAKPKRTGSDDRVRSALHYIRKNLGADVDISRLAELSCLSKDHFIKVFKSEMGETPMKYIIRCRIDQARLMLAAGDTPVKSIAYQLGFNDFSYFSRVFRNVTGQTPVQYRMNNKK